MITTGQSVTNHVTGETLVFRTTSADSNGEAVVVETFVEPNGAVAAAHVHPSQEEPFEILAGELEFRLGKKTARRRPRRPRDRPGGHASPVQERRRRDRALRLRGAARARLRAADRDDVHPRRRRQGEPEGDAEPAPARGDRTHHFDDVRLPFPPAWLQRVGLALGAPLGRLLGYRATYDASAPVPDGARRLAIGPAGTLSVGRPGRRSRGRPAII